MNASLYYNFFDYLCGRKLSLKRLSNFQDISRQLSDSEISQSSRRELLTCLLSRCVYNINGIVCLLDSTSNSLKPQLLYATLCASSDVCKIKLLAKVKCAFTAELVTLATLAVKRLSNQSNISLSDVFVLQCKLPEISRLLNNSTSIDSELIENWNQTQKLFLADSNHLISGAVDQLFDELLKPIDCDLHDPGALKVIEEAFMCTSNKWNTNKKNHPHNVSELVDVFYKQACGETSLDVVIHVNDLAEHVMTPSRIRLIIALHCCDAMQNLVTMMISLCRTTTIDVISLKRHYCSVVKGLKVIKIVVGAKPTASLYTRPWIQIQLWCAGMNRIIQCLLHLLNVSIEGVSEGHMEFDENQQLNHNDIVLLGHISKQFAHSSMIKYGALVLPHYQNIEKSENRENILLNYLAEVCGNVFMLYTTYSSSRIIMCALSRDHEHLALCISPLRWMIEHEKTFGCRIIVAALVLWITESPLKQENAWLSFSKTVSSLVVLVQDILPSFKIIEEALKYTCDSSQCVTSIEECCFVQPGVIVAALVLLCAASGSFASDTIIYRSFEEFYERSMHHAQLATSMLEWSCVLCESFSGVPIAVLQQLNALLKSVRSKETASIALCISQVTKLINELSSSRNIDSLSQLKKANHTYANDYLTTMHDLISQMPQESTVKVADVVRDLHRRNNDNMLVVTQTMNTIAHSNHPLSQSIHCYLVPSFQVSKLIDDDKQAWEVLYHEVYDIRPHLRSAVVCCQLRLLSFFSIDMQPSLGGSSMLVVDLGAVTVIVLHALRSLKTSTTHRSSEYQSCLNVVQRFVHMINLKVLQRALQFFLMYMISTSEVDAVYNASLYAHVCMDVVTCFISSQQMNFAANIINHELYSELMVHILQSYQRESDCSVQFVLQVLVRLGNLAREESSSVLGLAPIWALIALGCLCGYKCDIDTELLSEALLLSDEKDCMSQSAISSNNNCIRVWYVHKTENSAQSTLLNIKSSDSWNIADTTVTFTRKSALDASKVLLTIPFFPTLKSLFDALHHTQVGSGLEMRVHFLLRFVYLPIECNGFAALLQYTFKESLLAEHKNRFVAHAERNVSMHMFLLRRLLYEKAPRQHPLLWIFASLADAVSDSTLSHHPINMNDVLLFLNNFQTYELQSTLSLLELSRQLKRGKSGANGKHSSIDDEIGTAFGECYKFVTLLLLDDVVKLGTQRYPHAISFLVVSLVAFVDVSTHSPYNNIFSTVASVSAVQLLTNFVRSTNLTLSMPLLEESLLEYSRYYGWSKNTIHLYTSILNGLSLPNDTPNSTDDTPLRENRIVSHGLSPMQKPSTIDERRFKIERDIVQPIKLEIPNDSVSDALEANSGSAKIENIAKNAPSGSGLGDKYHISF